MEEFAAQRDGLFAAKPPCSTPQLQELDAYAELVERLRIEVSREREEQQANNVVGYIFGVRVRWSSVAPPQLGICLLFDAASVGGIQPQP